MFTTAINQMNAFVEQIDAFISAQILTPSRGEMLTNIANDIILLMQGGTSPLVNKENSHGIPEAFTLHNNYPNPFNPTTKIRFDIPYQSDVKITVYDILGRLIVVLLNSNFAPGSYETEWNSSAHSSGIYF